MDFGQSVFDVGQHGIARSLENPATPLGDFDLEDTTGNCASGEVVNARTALSYAPVWQALTVLSGDVAQLPLHIYERLQPRGKRRATEHPGHRLFHLRSNEEMCPFPWKQLMMKQALLRGNAYSFIERHGTKPVALWPLDPESTYPVRANGQLRYVSMNSENRPEELYPHEVFHLRGMGDDGLAGRSVVDLARNSWGMGMSAEQYSSRFFRNDARPSIVLEFPNAVDGPTAINILNHWSSRHGGSRNAGKPALVDRGGKVNPFGMSNKDAQFIEARQYQRTEVASWFNLPPHKVGDLTRATFSNIEQQSLDYVIYSLMPWLIRIQEECNAKLLSTDEQESGSHFFEFLTAALLRGDLQSRYSAYAIGRANGWLSADDVLEMENGNPLPNGQGSVYLQPLNMQPAQDQQPSATTDDTRHAHRQLMEDTIRRQCKRLGDSARRAAKKPAKWLEWLDGVLIAQHSGGILDQLEYPCRAAASIGMDYRAGGMTDDIFAAYRGALLDAADGESATFMSRVEEVTTKLERDLPLTLTGGNSHGATEYIPQD